LKTGTPETLAEKLTEKNTLINLSISTCMTCPETTRIRYLKEMSNKVDKEKSQILLLFGKGNSFEMINEFLTRMDLRNNTSIISGVIEDGPGISDVEYFQIYSFDIDPRLFLFGKDGKLNFIEKIGEEKQILKSDKIVKMLS
jgi:hypothetical protein